MRKFKVKLELAILTVLEIIALARLIVTKMTGNANFTTPDPPLADLTTAAVDLQTAELEVEDAKRTLAEKVVIQNQAEQALKDLLTNEGRYVDNKANGDKAIIESAGMKASDEPSPVGEMPKVENLSLTHGDNPGEVDAGWNSVKKKLNYGLQYSLQPIATPDWKNAGSPTKSKFTITSLPSGATVWVRVCANGTSGSGPFSDPATIVVP